MYIAYSLSIGFEMPNEYDEMEKFKAENEGFTETVTTSNYILFQKNTRMVCSLPIKGGDAE